MMKRVLNELTRDGVWNVYDEQTETFDKFKEWVLPKTELLANVDQDVRKSFEVVKKLLIHSYFEYKFVDVALANSLLIVEMSLKKRYKEINNKQWPKSKSFSKLINWFKDNDHLDDSSKDGLDRLRMLRNHFAHPENHTFAGIVYLQVFDPLANLINSVYR